MGELQDLPCLGEHGVQGQALSICEEPLTLMAVSATDLRISKRQRCISG